MYSFLKIKVLLTALVLTSQFTLTADVGKQLLSCSQIQSNLERLQCYDKLTVSISSVNSVTTNRKDDTLQEKSIESEFKVMHVEKPSELESIEQIQNNEIVDFGLPAKRTGDAEQIKARLVGDFKKWDENSVFELDNGQIWRAVRSNAKRRRSPVLLSNPELTITRGALGSYDLRIVGMRGRLKVKRFK